MVCWRGRPHTQSLKSPIRMPRSGNCASYSCSFSRWSGENGPWMLAMVYGVWLGRASLMARAWLPMEGILETHLDMEVWTRNCVPGFSSPWVTGRYSPSIAAVQAACCDPLRNRNSCRAITAGCSAIISARRCPQRRRERKGPPTLSVRKDRSCRAGRGAGPWNGVDVVGQAYRPLCQIP